MYLLLIFPYLLLWIIAYKKNKNKIKSTLDYCKLALITEISFYFYSLIQFGIVRMIIENDDKNILNTTIAVSYGTGMVNILAFFWTAIFTVLVMLFKKFKDIRNKL